MKTCRCGLWFLLMALPAGVLVVGLSEAQPDANIAIMARPSASYVSGDTSTGALNDDFDPTRSGDRSRGSYGNWPRRNTQWVQYDWDAAVSTERIDVYWWDDRRGVRLPSAARLLFWNGSEFVPVQTEEILGVAENRYNSLNFAEVATTRLRLEIDGNDQYSTGILEWKVYDSGKSPVFPPKVEADADRAVVLGGRTYLNGVVKTLSGDTTVQWSKASGPGWVTFADPAKLDTAATFTEPGNYVLRLTARHSGLSDADTLNVQVLQGPPAENLHPVDTMPYQINSPLWDQRARAIIVHWIPHCIDRINDPDLKEGGINNFIDAANKLQGKSGGSHRGYVFSNAWVYNTMESICVALMVDPKGDAAIIRAQQMMKDTLKDWIPRILAAQEPDGYLQTAFTLSDRQRWTDRYRGDHEGYVAGYYLEAAVSHYMLTGGKDLRLYNSAKKLADLWEANIGPDPGKQEWYDGHQAMEMALVRFGRFVNTVEGDGRGEKYIQLAKFLLDCRGGGSEYDQSHVPVIRQYEAVGHAVRASYNYAAMSDVAMETHDPDYQSAVMSLFDNMIHRKYYVTGGIGSGETSEGFGPDYSLRHNAYNESCSSCGLIFFLHKLNMAYHDARFADLYEETLYNALLGSLDLDGKNFYYQNPLEGRGARYPWHVCPCCVGNIPRVLLMLPTWTYVKDAANLYVNLYIGSRITVPGIAGTEVEMIQETDYPWSGDVAITVNPRNGKTFPIHLRVPGREVSDIYYNEPGADGILSIRVNGQTVQPPVVRGYAIIERAWKAGDRIELELPVQVQRVRAIDKVEATRGQVALRYGPLIYSVEAVDQNLDRSLSPHTRLTAEWNPDLLQGVITIKGRWADGSDLLAIPNYARANRLEETDEEGGDRSREITSKVWIKESRD
ncbi:MAG: glycoside hydrolase family 127 protein [Sedimentisphaerales bacterium]|nr:glycoside hydrolase family 127 protein [Sedimentisphaerales bacterium]